jgi:hypothetical protein
MGNKSSSLQNMFNKTPPTPVPIPAPVLAALSAPPPTPPQPIGPPAGYMASMDQGSWDIYSQLETTQEMSGLKLDPYNSFCNSSYTSSETLNKQCSNLTEYNCKQVGCCVFTSNKKCEAGGQNGATYSPNLDYYYYRNKCYGNKCPK